MGIQVSASRTDLFLACPRPFDPEIEPDSREDEDTSKADYGSAVHELVTDQKSSTDEVLAKWGISTEESLLAVAHASRAIKYLKSWLAGENPFKLKFKIVRVETPLATYLGDSGEVETRESKFDPETHHYDLDENEIGGTPDWVLVSLPEKGKGKKVQPEIRLVLDLKTGDFHSNEFASPSKMGQMRTLALQTGATHVGIFYSARTGGSDALYVDPISDEALGDHHLTMRGAQALVGSGFMRPDPTRQCRYCPVRGSCSATVGEVVRETSALVKRLDGSGALRLEQSIDRGAFHQIWSNMEKLAKIVRDQTREEVREGAVIERPDGKVLTLSEVRRESLSMTSIREALGKAAGDEEIERLRKLGAVKEVCFEELRAK
jgi:PD-(D/E)XK nuclease superfamily